jgi:hypothetical protein
MGISVPSLMLCSYQIDFIDPISDLAIKEEIPLPQIFQDILTELEYLELDYKTLQQSLGDEDDDEEEDPYHVTIKLHKLESKENYFDNHLISDEIVISIISQLKWYEVVRLGELNRAWWRVKKKKFFLFFILE